MQHYEDEQNKEKKERNYFIGEKRFCGNAFAKALLQKFFAKDFLLKGMMKEGKITAPGAQKAR